jgi:hypothetical protein
VFSLSDSSLVMRFKYNMPWKTCLSRFVSVVLCCTHSGETVVKLFVHHISVNSLPTFTNSYIQLQSMVGRFSRDFHQVYQWKSYISSTIQVCNWKCTCVGTSAGMPAQTCNFFPSSCKPRCPCMLKPVS